LHAALQNERGKKIPSIRVILHQVGLNLAIPAAMADIEHMLGAKMEAEPPGPGGPPAPFLEVKKSEDEQKVSLGNHGAGDGMPADDLTPENFRDNVLSYMWRLLDKFGGPTQYLNHKLNTEELVEKFAADLKTTFPPRPNLCLAIAQKSLRFTSLTWLIARNALRSRFPSAIQPNLWQMNI